VGDVVDETNKQHKQNKTKQNKTKQTNKTKQNKTNFPIEISMALYSAELLTLDQRGIAALSSR